MTKGRLAGRPIRLFALVKRKVFPMVAVARTGRNRGASYPRVWIEPAVLRASLPSSAKHIIHAMLVLADPETSVVEGRSLTEISKACNLSRSTVVRLLNLLERTGWMKRTIPSQQQKGQNEMTGYQFLIPDSVQSDPSVMVGLGGPDDTRSGVDQAVLFTVVPPTGVLPGSTDVPPTAGTSVDQDPKSNSSRSEENDLTSATDKRAGVSGENAGTVVAAYIDSYKKTWDSTPMQIIIKRIGRDAKLLLADGIAFDTVLDAARELGTTEYANLATVTHRLVTRRENDPRYHNQSWLNTRTVAPFSSEVGSWDAVGTWGREQAVAPNWDDAGPSNWDATVRWYAGEDGDDYHDYDGAELNDDEIREACP